MLKVARTANAMALQLLKSEDYPCELWELRASLNNLFSGASDFSIPEPRPDEGSEEWEGTVAEIRRTLEAVIDDFPKAALGTVEDAWDYFYRVVNTV